MRFIFNEYLEKNHLRTVDVARRCGVHRQQIEQLAIADGVTLKTIGMLCRVLEIEPMQLIHFDLKQVKRDNEIVNVKADRAALEKREAALANALAEEREAALANATT